LLVIGRGEAAVVRGDWSCIYEKGGREQRGKRANHVEPLPRSSQTESALRGFVVVKVGAALG
jgi:hypothetical protein